MSNFVPKKQHFPQALIFCFHLKKTAAEAHRMLVEAYGEHAPSERTCERWFSRFKSGDFSTEDKERPGQPKKFEDAELEALLDEDSSQTQDELARALNVDRSTVGYRLRALGFIRKLSNWVPHELTPAQAERRLVTCEMLLARHKKRGFLYRIVTGDEKWIHYDNPKRKASYVKPGQPATSQPKQEIHGDKVMLSIWWDEEGVVYYELLRSGQTIDGPFYRQQLIRLKQAIKEKRTKWETRKETLIFLHDNARPHIEKSVKNYLENSGWEVLAHAPYSPDLAPSDYHLFRSMQNHMDGERFSSVEEIQNWLDAFIASKDEEFFKAGIRQLPTLWQKVIASDGQYFD